MTDLLDCMPGFLSFLESCNIGAKDEDDLRFLTRAIRNHPDLGWADAFSQGQMRSKRWLVDALTPYHPDIDLCFVMGGWVGTLGKMLIRRYGWRVRSFDLDDRATLAADDVNRLDVTNGWTFKAATADMMALSYDPTHYTAVRASGVVRPQVDRADLIVNTSCEHIDFPAWIKLLPAGQLVALQSNDFTQGAGHVCCYASLGDFVAAADLTDVDYCGELDCGHYRRWMVIGRK